MASLQKNLNRTTSCTYNPFDSDDDEETRTNPSLPFNRTVSDPLEYANPFEEKKQSSSTTKAKSVNNNVDREMLLGHGNPSLPRSYSYGATRARYRNFGENGGYENQTMEELEQYAVYKSEETTATVNNCLKVAEDIKEDAAKTLADLHHQGEQIRRTHNLAPNIDHDLSAAEKLLGSLGGIFSRRWRPQKTQPINGPINIPDNSIQRRVNDLEERKALGIVKSPKSRGNTQIYPSGVETTQARIEREKAKQDDSTSLLSNMLDQLKDMAVDMGQEIGRQNKALDHLDDDVTELGFRVKGANARARRLLGK